MGKGSFVDHPLTVFGLWIGGLFAFAQLGMAWQANALVYLWLTATLPWFVVLADPPRAKAIAAFLQAPSYGALYHRLVTPVANLPTDWRCYDWALRLAVLYPILSMVLIWAATGRAGTIGTVEVLPPHDSWIVSLATFGALLVVASPGIERWAMLYGSNTQAFLSMLVPSAAGALAIWVAAETVNAFVVVGALMVAALVTLSVKISNYLFQSSTGSGAAIIAATVTEASLLFAWGSANVAVTVVGPIYAFIFFIAALFAIAAAISCTILVNHVTRNGRGTSAYFLLSLAVFVFLAATIAYAPWPESRTEDRSLFLFLALLPLVNALTDYASYVVTIRLVRWGLNSRGWAVAAALVDLLAALVIFTLLGGLLVLVVSGANALAGVPLFPLAPLFDGIRADPWAYVWLYLMLFSTLLPTLVHLIAGTFSLVALPFFALIDVPVADWIDNPDHTRMLVTPLVLGLAATVSVLLPVLMFRALYVAANHYIPGLAGAYLDLLQGFARALGQA